MAPIGHRIDDADIPISTNGRGETFGAILSRRLSRRQFVQGGVAASSIVLAGPVAGYAQGTPEAETPVAMPDATSGATPIAGRGLTFDPIPQDTEDAIKVSPGYRATVLLKWGDPITADAPDFDPDNLTPEAQTKQFGYNCDFVGFLPLPAGSDSSDRGLLVVNHEYTNTELMFADWDPENPQPTQNQVDVEIEAHGLSVVEVRRNEGGEWEVVRDSQNNRRLTGTTPMELTGPAAGAPLMQTSADPSGTQVLGTLNNCAAGITPWGTVVSGEENFHQYFGNFGKLAQDHPANASHERIGMPEEMSERGWELFQDRFDVSKEPNEAFRFGWAVELDPYEPQSTPKKRTAIGRFKHEAITSIVAHTGQVALYSGDDQRFEYVYKFVTRGLFDPFDQAANMDLLDEGTLYVARFNDDGSGDWLPLLHGQGPLTAENGFASQAEVLINARAAGDLLRATKMDRPEDIEPNPVNGRVYIVLTNNTQRGTPEGEEGPNAANPRPENAHGHIIELTEDRGDHTATTFTWDIFLLCGDPSDPTTFFAGFPKDRVSGISSPDNITFDRAGNLWISTDGQPGTFKVNDGIFAVPVAGPERGYLRQFFSAVPEAEVCGPVFTPDNTTLFAAIQHPGEGGTLAEPISRWPDGTNMPRPSLVVIQAENGGRIGMAT